VAIIPTGDELVAPGPDPKVGEIIEYNSLVLGAQVTSWGGEAVRFPIIPDDMEALCEAVSKAAEDADQILLNAGSSAGRGDFSARVAQRLGDLLVHGINVRPGHPVVIGTIGEQAVPMIGVPGYPVSAALTGEIIVQPLLRQWLGCGPTRPVMKRRSPGSCSLRRATTSSCAGRGQVGADAGRTALARGRRIASLLRAAAS
jgi:putative molybdopterin biosynthesis protein